jgi:hypothetical protein
MVLEYMSLGPVMDYDEDTKTFFSRVSKGNGGVLNERETCKYVERRCSCCS